MKQKLIDREKLRMELRKLFAEYSYLIDKGLAYAVEDVIDEQPIVEADPTTTFVTGMTTEKQIKLAPVVLCKDCKHWQQANEFNPQNYKKCICLDRYTNAYFYCVYGQKKNEVNDETD